MLEFIARELIDRQSDDDALVSLCRLSVSALMAVQRC